MGETGCLRLKRKNWASATWTPSPRVPYYQQYFGVQCNFCTAVKRLKIFFLIDVLSALLNDLDFMFLYLEVNKKAFLLKGLSRYLPVNLANFVFKYTHSMKIKIVCAYSGS